MPTAIFQVTISGKDGGGFLWQNVIHIRGTVATTPTLADMKELADYVQGNLITPLRAAKAESNTMLNIGIKEVLPGSSFTFNRPMNEPGDRVGTENVGAVAGKITMYPETGAITGRIFINGCLDDDFDKDVIQPAYETLLDDVADALNLIDGSPITFLWELGIFNKDTSGFVPVDGCATQQQPGILSKRVRG